MTGPTHIDLEPPQAEPATPTTTSASELAPTASRRPLPSTGQFLAIAGMILLAALVAFIALYALPARYDQGPGTIVILLVAGLVALTLLLYLGTVIHRTVGVGTRSSALGMPEGSIRALIALSLVLMFAIIGVTVLYSGIGTGEEVVSNGITSAQIDDLENVQIISISVVDPAASPGTERFNVVARPEISQSGHDFGLQLLTTVSTLVVAVAGFYFGTRAVAQGSRAALAAMAPQSTTPQDGGAGTATGEGAGPGTGGAVAASEVLDEDQVIGAVEDAAAGDDESPEVTATADAAAAADEAAAAEDEDKP